MAAEPLLCLRDVTANFGGIRAVDRLSFDVAAGTIVSLIGPNGAGKTTVFNVISGFVRARGSVRFSGVELLGRPPYRRSGLGLGRIFQNLQLFDDMTLLDNILVGEHASLGGNVLFDLVRFPLAARERTARMRATEIARMLGLQDYLHRPARTLPLGFQKLAGVARALAGGTEMLLLDEPAAGLSRQESEALGDLIVGLRHDIGLTILLVEHNMRLVMGISDRVVVLREGRKLAEGSPAEIRRNPAVIEAYLGGTDWLEDLPEDQHRLSRH